jgi:tagaturonate reductase
MTALPETVLQFGAGNFLRAFFDLFVAEANASGQEVGQIVIVQSTPGPRVERINAQKGAYHVVLRGISGGERIDEVKRVDSVSRGLVADSQWEEVLAVACSADLRAIVSNTTEKGYELDDSDTLSSVPPRSFPAKLLLCLQARFEAGLDGVAIVPCELFDGNADRLFRIVDGLAERWGRSADLRRWIHGSCRWHNNLVDRIVTGCPDEHALLAEDALLTACEPYALFAIEHAGADGEAPFTLFEHPAVVRTGDVTPYGLRKVRLLNGAHSALVCRALPVGFRTVREAVEDAAIREWLEQLMFEEIVPTIEDRVEDAAGFARDVLERFLNPFIDHELEKIALHHEEKVKVRLVPTLDEYRQKLGREPRVLTELLRERG